MTEDQLANEEYMQATIRTAGDLMTIATTPEVTELSHLALPEVERISNEIARVVPAGNVPGLILSGLARLEGRTVHQEDSQKHIELLFRGVRHSLDKAVYHTFFTGPAAVLYGYQQLLKLAGKEPETAFLEGTWQFYLEFALREDTARHANETTGFQNHLSRSHLDLGEADALAAWMMTIVHTLYQLPHMLRNEWRERVIMKVLADVAEEYKEPEHATYRRLYTVWEKQRPYDSYSATEDYPTYRHNLFDRFWRPYYNQMSAQARAEFDNRLAAQTHDHLPAYQRQLSWLAYLQPEAHRETRVLYGTQETLVGVIYQNRYYLARLPDLFDPHMTRRVAAAIVNTPPETSEASLDDVLVRAARMEHAALRRQLDDQTKSELEHLRRAPVLLNWDVQDSRYPLAAIRSYAKRGIGDHALTIVRTDKSMIFDQSHIFFDGIWGAVISQVMTYQAVRWANYIHAQDKRVRRAALPYSPALQATPRLIRQAERAQIGPEMSAENTAVRLKDILLLRKLLKQRSDLAQITVNDLFILYRCLHALLYQPSEQVEQILTTLAESKNVKSRQAGYAVREAIERMRNKNPSILIPIDASRFDPKERVFPTTFRNPLTDFMSYHDQTLAALRDYQNAGPRQQRSAEKTFEAAQGTYLRLVGGFGELLSRYKAIALQGESTSTATIRALAHLPQPLQRMLNNIPGRFEILNEIIKGEEVISNVGKVATDSSLRRFITAKDDNQQKTLAWGILTDDDGVIHLSLRDFRPYIKLLQEAGHGDYAQIIVQDYVDSYAQGLNRYIKELRDITNASSQADSRTSRWGLFRR